MTVPAPDPRSQELADLLARVARADRAAFARLYQRSSAQLLGVVLRIQRDRALAEDVLQEVFVNIWRAAGSFDPQRSQPWTWLASVARHRAIDSLRRADSQPRLEARVREDEDGESHDLLADVPCDLPGPQELLGALTQARAVKRCLAGLSNRVLRQAPRV